MAKNYQMRFLPLFEDDLNEIIDYISFELQNPAAAEALLDDIQRALAERLPFAERFEPFRSTRERKYPYYRISVKNYTIFMSLAISWKFGGFCTAAETG